MATTWKDRLRCVVASAPGTGDITVGAASSASMQGFGASDDGKTFEVTISEGNSWEVVRCTYTHSATRLNRSTGTLLSSSTGSAISFGSGAVVTVAMHAAWMAELEARTEALHVLILPVAGVSDGAANSAALQAAVNAYEHVLVRTAGVYCISTPISIPSNRTVDIGQGVVLCKVDDITNACTVFQNSDMAGGNESITLTGKGAIYCNANSYAAAKAANATGCPTLPEPMSSVPALTVRSSALYTMNGLHFENVRRLRVSGLTVMMSSKYIIYGASLTDFAFEDLNLYSDDTINPANGSTYGRDGIHIQGLSSIGVIRRIRGTVNDDFIVLNTRDVDSFTSSRSVGYVRDVLIEDIRGRNQRRSGAAVHIYGGCDTRTESSSKDTAPAITSMSQSGDVVTVNLVAAHGMVPGQVFDITGSNPSGYNAALASVVSTPSATSFTFYATSGIGAYVGSAVLTRYYSVEGIVVRDVDQQTYSGAAIAISATTDTGLNYAVVHGLIIEDVSGVVEAPSGGAGVIALDNCLLVGLTVRNPRSRNAVLHPIVNLAVTSNNKTRGLVLVENPIAEVPYMPYSGSGQAWINMPGSHETVCIRGGSVQVEDGGGGWRQAINVGSASGSVIVDGLSCSAAAGTTAQMVRCDHAALGFLEIRNCYASGNVVLAHLGGSITSGTCKLVGNALPARATPPVNYYGTGLTLIMSGNFFGAQSGGLIYAFTSGSITVRSAGDNEFSGSTLFGAGTSGGAAGFHVIGSGTDLQVDGSAAYIGATPGDQFWNTNAAFGSGVGKYCRSNAGAWVKVF